MDSDKRDAIIAGAKARHDKAIAEIRERVDRRKAECVVMSHRARRYGLDVTPELVNRHYEWFKRWDEGGIAKGYLMQRLGLKLIKRDN